MRHPWDPVGRFTDAELMLSALAGLLLLVLVMLGWKLLRARRAEREAAAWALCEHLDHYLDDLSRHPGHAFDPDALGERLQQARNLKRAHFPELYPEMMEVMRVHAELATALLDQHLERHGVPSGPGGEERQDRIATLHRRAHDAVAQLKRRCREVAQLEGGPGAC